MKVFDFNRLFIYDLANNHQGDVAHALEIVTAIGAVNAAAGVRGALKFQFRDLDTLVHPAYLDRKDVKHIPRFLETRLSKNDFAVLTKAVRDNGMITMATPFDEASVDMLLALDIEVIKIASCSADDRPLLEKVAATNRPIIVSTGGLSIAQIDRLVSFLEHRHAHFALMHCVAIYPTPAEKLRLSQIEMLINRYPGVAVGFSTHEDPEDTDAVKIAYAKGARLFERHVGKKSEKYPLNNYSSTAEQVERWLHACKQAQSYCGGAERVPAPKEELASLASLKRGVFTAVALKKGDAVLRENVYFAMPYQDGQLSSGHWHNGIVADKDYAADQSLSAQLADFSMPHEEQVYQIMLQVKGMLNQARIFIGENSSIEISHHYGLDRFREFGAVIIDCINRAYCKKLIVQLPRQKHPYHYHNKKEETFQLLYGDLEVLCEGEKVRLSPGDTFLVAPGQWHKFHTLDGAIFEEVSTTHYNDDSFYEDERIAILPREKRKTTIPNWESAVTDTL